MNGYEMQCYIHAYTQETNNTMLNINLNISSHHSRYKLIVKQCEHTCLFSVVEYIKKLIQKFVMYS